MPSTGSVQVYRNGRFAVGESGATNVTPEYARRLSENSPGAEVHWVCTNWDSKMRATYIDGREVQYAETWGGRRDAEAHGRATRAVNSERAVEARRSSVVAVLAVASDKVYLSSDERPLVEVTWPDLRAAATQDDRSLAAIYTRALQSAEEMAAAERMVVQS